ncbi:hypothetical protein F8S20_22145 [Nostoc sp. BAE]|nr:hypothetical protein [Nostoc commune BAE]
MILDTFRSPLTLLKKGGTGVKVPLFKGDLGGSKTFDTSSKGLPSKKIFHCYCSLLTVDGLRVFSQQSTTLTGHHIKLQNSNFIITAFCKYTRLQIYFNHFFCLILSYLNLLMEISLLLAKLSHNYYQH